MFIILHVKIDILAILLVSFTIILKKLPAKSKDWDETQQRL